EEQRVRAGIQVVGDAPVVQDDPPYLVAERRAARLAGQQRVPAAGPQPFGEVPSGGRLAAPVRPLEGDEPATGRGARHLLAALAPGLTLVGEELDAPVRLRPARAAQQGVSLRQLGVQPPHVRLLWRALARW